MNKYRKTERAKNCARLVELWFARGFDKPETQEFIKLSKRTTFRDLVDYLAFELEQRDAINLANEMLPSKTKRLKAEKKD